MRKELIVLDIINILKLLSSFDASSWIFSTFPKVQLFKPLPFTVFTREKIPRIRITNVEIVVTSLRASVIPKLLTTNQRSPPHRKWSNNEDVYSQKSSLTPLTLNSTNSTNSTKCKQGASPQGNFFQSIIVNSPNYDKGYF